MTSLIEPHALAARAATELADAPADAILGWAAETVPRLAVTSSFGADSAVLLHLVSETVPRLPVLFLDTGFHFSETLDHRRQLAQVLGLTVVDVRPELTVAQQAAVHGPELFRSDPDACCRMRKTLPLRAALADYDGWATGVRRDQTPERADTQPVEASALGERWLVRVAPLASWTAAEMSDYLDRHDLPRHPLHSQGYRSIGCAPCTEPSAGPDPRSGRWAGTGKTECGIHVHDDGVVRRAG